MGKTKKPVHISRSLTEGYHQTQEQLVEIKKDKQKMFIGIPKETTMQENRIALVPSSVSTLTKQGHRIVVESGAGDKSNFTDKDFSEAGAEIEFSHKKVLEADLILKVAPPTIEEIDLMKPNQILISPLHLPIIDVEYIKHLQKSRVIALAMEYIQDASGSFPVVRIMSELAGTSAVLAAAGLMASTRNGKGILLGGISGVPPARVVILGAGMVAEYATRTALGLGAEVRIFDNNIYKLKRIQDLVGSKLYTSVINPVYLQEELMLADVAIGAIHSDSGRSPVVVPEEMVMKMPPGAVIIDVSIDQGGCFETSRVTSLEKPTFTVHDVIHYCVPNIASKFARTASIAVSNILMPMLLQVANVGSMEKLLFSHFGLRHGVYTYKGCLTNEYLGQRFGIKSTSLELLITSSL